MHHVTHPSQICQKINMQMMILKIMRLSPSATLRVNRIKISCITQTTKLFLVDRRNLSQENISLKMILLQQMTNHLTQLRNRSRVAILRKVKKREHRVRAMMNKRRMKFLLMSLLLLLLKYLQKEGLIGLMKSQEEVLTRQFIGGLILRQGERQHGML